MGIVYKCHDSTTGHEVALKTFKQDYLSVRIIRERFLDEAVNWVLLGTHPNLVRAIGVTQLSNPPRPCIILEWIEGRYPDADPSLATVLNRRKRRPLGFIQSLGIALGIARGMHHATMALENFVHSDLKPENILIDEDWHPRITDMGMSYSRMSTQYETGSLHSILFPCTPGFCAPEQYDPEVPVDQRADMYALGCILYEMLTGQRINPGQDEKSRKQLDREGRLREIPNALPVCIREIISTCIQPDAADRYESWAAIETAISTCYHQQTGKPPEPVILPAKDTDEISREKSNTFLTLGKSFYEFGDMGRAIEYIDKGLVLAKVLEDSKLITRLLFQRGVVQLESGSLPPASEDLHLALTLARHGEELESLADVLSILGMLYVRQEEYDKAMDYLQQALTVARECSKRDVEVMVLGNLGSAAGQSGDPEKAVEYFRKLLHWCNESGDEVLRSHTIASLGVASYDLEKYHEAIDFLKQAQEIYQQHGDDPGRLHVLEHLWKSYAACGQQQKASHCHEEYDELASRLK